MTKVVAKVVTKRWAFTSETGRGRMTAREANRIRWAEYGGAPLPESKYKFWCMDNDGSRQRVKHVRNEDAILYFAFFDNSAHGGGDGGESLCHELYIDAIARLTKTQLRLTNGHYGKPQLRLENGNYNIRITHVETEKTIHLSEDQYYRPDVYVRFECDVGLSTKWNGELYIEVWHTHRVPAEKIANLKAHRVPVIQVIVPKVFQYKYDGDTTTDEHEEKYITDMVGRLEEYMAGYVLSDPNSVEHLEEQVLDLAGKIAKHEKSAAANAVVIENLEGTIRTTEEAARRLLAERDSAARTLRAKCDDLSSKIQEQSDRHVSEIIELDRNALLEREKMLGLEDEIIGLKAERTNLLGALKERTIALAGASGIALLGLFLGVRVLLGK